MITTMRLVKTGVRMEERMGIQMYMHVQLLLVNPDDVNFVREG
jgi:hypothetical protein